MENERSIEARASGHQLSSRERVAENVGMRHKTNEYANNNKTIAKKT